MRRIANLILSVAVMVSAVTTPVLALTVQPMSERDLVDSSPWIVAGVVTAIESGLFADGAIRTDITVAIEETLRGATPPEELRFRQPGGRVGDALAVFPGSPEFALGERVLVFAEPGMDGVLRVAQGPLGKMRIITLADGSELALPAGTTEDTSATPAVVSATAPGVPLARWRATVNESDRSGRARGPAPLASAISAPAEQPVRSEPHEFTFLGTTSRWMEANSSQFVDYWLDDDGDAGLPSRGFTETAAALAAWTNGGFTGLQLRAPGVYANPDLCLSPFPQFSHITYEDPCDEISDLVGCAGVLGRGGFYADCSQTWVSGGVTFCKITRGDIVTNRHPGCVWSSALFAELMTHELGHTIGLGHSSQAPAEPNPKLAEATMYYSIHNDGRGASLRDDDVCGLNAIYLWQRFNDVPVASVYAPYIEKIFAAGITGGCGGSFYCPTAAVTREQMAVFILRALGVTSPPTPGAQTFNDIGPGNVFWPWVEHFAALGLTGGCGNDNYCPQQPVSRAEMAVFLMRAFGVFSPPAPAFQRFNDVAPTSPFYAFVEALFNYGITGGCSATPSLYCPDDAVSREQMAVFLTRAFL